MTQSHHCWFIINIWKSDHHLNMTLGTELDIKFPLSFLSAESLCWWKWILSYFKTQKLWGKFEYKSVGLIFWCGHCCAFSFTHISHFNIPRPAITLKQLQNWVFLFTVYAPQSPAPLPKLRLTWVHIREFSQPEGMPSGTEALSFIWEGQQQQQEEEQCTVIVNMVKDS